MSHVTSDNFVLFLTGKSVFQVLKYLEMCSKLEIPAITE